MLLSFLYHNRLPILISILGYYFESWRTLLIDLIIASYLIIILHAIRIILSFNQHSFIIIILRYKQLPATYSIQNQNILIYHQPSPIYDQRPSIYHQNNLIYHQIFPYTISVLPCTISILPSTTTILPSTVTTLPSMLFSFTNYYNPPSAWRASIAASNSRRAVAKNRLRSGLSGRAPHGPEI